MTFCRASVRSGRASTNGDAKWGETFDPTWRLAYVHGQFALIVPPDFPASLSA